MFRAPLDAAHPKLEEGAQRGTERELLRHPSIVEHRHEVACERALQLCLLVEVVEDDECVRISTHLGLLRGGGGRGRWQGGGGKGEVARGRWQGGGGKGEVVGAGGKGQVEGAGGKGEVVRRKWQGRGGKGGMARGTWQGGGVKGEVLRGRW